MSILSFKSKGEVLGQEIHKGTSLIQYLKVVYTFPPAFTPVLKSFMIDKGL